MSSHGFMIFAYNNEQHDYLKQAIFLADRITKYMDLPVTIVTNKKTLGEQTTGYNVIITDSESKGSRRMDRNKKDTVGVWYNANRNDAYELTPYDETIVIDSDVVVCSPDLTWLFNNNVDSFLCYRDAFDVTNRGGLDGDDTFGQFKMPHFWATIIYFRKDASAKRIFENIAMIKEYWAFFKELYKFSTGLYRNDYAVSIALLMEYGHRVDAVPSLYGKLFTATPDTEIKISGNEIVVQFDKHENNTSVPKEILISAQDVHCLNKFSLEKAIYLNSVHYKEELPF